MKRKFLYPILMAVAIIILYLAENYIDQQEIEQARVEGEAMALDYKLFLPESTTQTVINHNYYSLSYSEPHEQAEWVAYELKKEHVVSANFDRPYFEIDAQVKTGAAHWRNYKNSGYDRGHLCPAGDRRFTKEAYEETFLTSNITPQMHDFNSGVWNRLEQQSRRWAKEYDGIFIITGGVLTSSMAHIGSEQVTVPYAFYKIVFDRRGDTDTALAFLIPHEESDKNLEQFATSIDVIEKQTGIDFFPQLDDPVENQLEAAIPIDDWFN